MITGTEGANNKYKVKTIVQDNGCLFFTMLLFKTCDSKQVAVSFRGLGSNSLKMFYLKQKSVGERFVYCINENVKNGNFEKCLKFYLTDFEEKLSQDRC